MIRCLAYIIVFSFYSFGFLACKKAQEKVVSYDKQVVRITMRDGIQLNTEIYRPKGSFEDLPFLITRTPYGLRHDEKGLHTYLGSTYKDLADEQYIFVFQDIRGRYESEGEFVMMRPTRNREDPKSIDEGTDTYDTIEWLLESVENHNGKAGVLGISYGGWLAVMSLVEPHPALAATSPQASPSDMYLGDDFLHNGALRLSPAFGYAALMESDNVNAPFGFDQHDAYEFFLDMGPLSNANDKYFMGKLPSWNNFMEHPNYDEYWKNLNVDHNLSSVPVPTLNVAGWWDAEDFYGPMKVYQTLEQFDQQDHNFLVAGPWRHGGWSRDQGDQLDRIQFDAPTGEYFRKKIQAPFFAYYLKGKGQWIVEEAKIFQVGSNKWKEYGMWPIEEVDKKVAYLKADGTISFDPPQHKEEQYREYISDPDAPVPYTKRPMAGFWQEIQSKALWKVEDQRFVHLRPDVLSWETAPLEEDLCIAGEIIASLHASTSGTDCDWIVKLIDVYPEDYKEKEMAGYQLMVADEVLRARFRNGFEEPEALVPNKVTGYQIGLNSRNYCFREGHKVMVQIQSTWFPLIDRNPQKFVNIPTAIAEDYQKAVQRIYNSQAYPSFIELPVEMK